MDIEKYLKENINEAETRQKIIDEVLYDILGWPVESVRPESRTESNGYIDYLLTKKNSKPIWLIEAKRIGYYFDLPNNFNSKQLNRKINLRQLLSDDNIKSSIEQAKGYAEDVGCDYVTITNGLVWITFHLKPKEKSWKDQNANVITNTSFFFEKQTEAINLFGYKAVVEDQALFKNVGSSIAKAQELWYPNQRIISYDRPVQDNEFSAVLGGLSRKYLGNIPEKDSDFMEKCYVFNKKEDGVLKKNLNGFIEDSITPFFESIGVRQISDYGSGNKFGKKLRKYATNRNSDSVLILFGGRGSGKSTFIRKFLYHTPPEIIVDHTVINIVDLLSCTQDKDKLSSEIWQNLVDQLDFDKILNSDRNALLKFLEPEYGIYKKQLLFNAKAGSEFYDNLINEFIVEKKKDKVYLCQKLSNYWRSKGRAPIIVIDNMDQLNFEIQDISFLTAMELSSKLSCLVIISMREERFYEAKKRGVLDAYHNNGFHITSPGISEVLKRRLRYIVERMQRSSDIEEEFGLESKSDFEVICSFLQTCIHDLSRVKSELRTFLDFATHGDVRQALDYFKSFISSGYTNIREITSKHSWNFLHHQVLKPMMVPDRYFFNEDVSRIVNIYKIRNNGDGSHFTGLRILRRLYDFGIQSRYSRFTDLRFLISLQEETYGSAIDAVENIDIFLQRGLIEANNRLDRYSLDVDSVRITNFGRYMLNQLVNSFVYCDLVSLETGLGNQSLANEFVSMAHTEVKHFENNEILKRLEVRVNRVKLFADYLLEEEKQEMEELNTSSEITLFMPTFKNSIIRECTEILARAKKRNPN
ncbi:AAA family ATPase [Leptospira santarosai]|uniref:AAA family ATPase n=1 Tax=Leptospira santarosai TaxID=28183 RepID=UPI0024AF4551|nr:AAA family ATPase [Leptospira santarosai]MDI7230082.1 AAA family ATPase [Leptospira santarosai]